jgi:hypothetical protein
MDRAVLTVERALELYGPPVYVRKQIVHNKHIVARPEGLGAVFVEDTVEVPEGLSSSSPRTAWRRPCMPRRGGSVFGRTEPGPTAQRSSIRNSR